MSMMIQKTVLADHNSPLFEDSVNIKVFMLFPWGPRGAYYFARISSCIQKHWPY